LGYDVKKELDTPTESLARMVRVVRENALPEIIGSERNVVNKNKMIVKQKQPHRKQGALIKI
ncbi:MAG: hypothetical protein WBP64_12570, partial [Nitrososphaeraceae archaeon]